MTRAAGGPVDPPVTVLVVDDQAVVRSGLRAILESEPGLVVVGEAADGEEAVALARRRRPDVVLMDVRMPRLDGIAATRLLTAGPDPVDVVVLTTFDTDEHVFGALQAGAAGFLLKDTSPERIVEAVRRVAAGDGLVAPEVTRRLVRRFAAAVPALHPDPRADRLTPREHDVLRGLAAGLANAEIGRRLFLEEATVKTHVGRVLAKLGLASRVQAVVWAYETGYVAPTGTPPAAGG